jgi:rod shape-determining protein MreD
MSLPLAAAGAVVLARLELSVAPYLKIADHKPDLGLIAVVSIASVFGLERAIGWAFVGGLMLDLLSAGPYRPLGSTAFTLLLIAGLAAAISRALPSGRIVIAVVLVLVLGVLYHLLILFFISLRGASAADPLGTALPIAVLDALLAIPVAAVAFLADRRLRAQQGLGW